MRKAFIVSALIFFFVDSYSQNIQLLYGKGKEKGFVTSTVEMFKPDKLGNTYFFIDFTYGNDGIKGVNSAYWEISRAFNLWKSPLAFHAEYNGGLIQWKSGYPNNSANTINNAWLTGLEYSFIDKKASRGLTLQALYKYIQGKNNKSFQLTAVWFINMIDTKLSFTGFADFWKEDNIFQNTPRKYVFLSQPQLWLNLTSKFSVGSEIQIGYNFGGIEMLDVMPTLAVKYNF
jgi:hypothetical protein